MTVGFQAGSAVLKATIIFVVTFLLASNEAQAEEHNWDISEQKRMPLGSARAFTNDYFGDGHDRWRTGSWTFSLFETVKQVDWEANNFDVMEFNFRNELFSATSEQVGKTGTDRPYGLLFGAGFFNHTVRPDYYYKTGAEFQILSSNDIVLNYHQRVHEFLNLAKPFQDAGFMRFKLLPSLRLEAGTEWSGEIVDTRPFVAFESGAETFGRAGVDFVLGSMKDTRVFARDGTTGFLLPPRHAPNQEGWSALAGFDSTFVMTSHLFDARADSNGVGLVDHKRIRHRARLGVQGDFWGARVFFGQTILGKEFEGQIVPQRVGSLTINTTF